LFKSIKIVITKYKDEYLYVEWFYEHPDGSTNGKTIGCVIKANGKWGWRNETKRDENGRWNFGYVE
jgi:hypothetical protein